VSELTRRGVATRLVATLVGVALLLAGTLVGTDDDFPFGPFRMYATTDKLDSPVADTRVEARDAGGAHLVLGEGDTGIRRAEIEGQLPGSSPTRRGSRRSPPRTLSATPAPGRSPRCRS